MPCLPRLGLVFLFAAALLAVGCGGDASGESAQGVEKGVYGDKTGDASGETEVILDETPEVLVDDAPEAPDTPAEAPIVSAPAEAPVVTPPAPSGDIVNRDDHVDFALDFLGRQAYNSIPGLMELYGNRVRYFDRGSIARAQVAEDKGNYFARWPNRYFEISGPVRATRGGSPTIRFDYEFEVSDARVTETRDGRAWTELGLSPAGNGYVITSERGGTY